MNTNKTEQTMNLNALKRPIIVSVKLKQLLLYDYFRSRYRFQVVFLPILFCFQTHPIDKNDFFNRLYTCTTKYVYNVKTVPMLLLNWRTYPTNRSV